MIKFIYCLIVFFSIIVVPGINAQSWAPLGNGLDFPVNVIVDYNGSILAGSDLVNKWNGSSWTAITDGMYGLFGVTEVDAMTVNNNNLFAGGIFFVNTPDLNWYNYAARFNGSSWTTCGSGTGNDGWGMNDNPVAMISYGDNLYAGGKFTTAGGDPLDPQITMYIARFDGSQWNPVGGGMNEHITDMTVYNNQLIVSGYFTQAGSIQANYVAAWDGSAWHSLGSGMSSTGVCKVTALAVHNGNLYAGGLFETAGGVTANNIAKWNGLSWSTVGSGINGQVYALVSYYGNLYAGGNFSTASGDPGNYIIKWNGTQWLEVNGGTDDAVNWFLVKDNNLYVGGYFTMAGNQPANHIAVYSDGSTAVDEQKSQLTGFVLCQNYPNPFNNVTVIKYTLPVEGLVTLVIYNAIGEKIAALIKEDKKAGNYEVKFDAGDFPSGIYFYKLQSGDFIQTRKMILLK